MATYACPRCNGTFTSKRAFSSHYTTVHTKGQPNAFTRKVKKVKRIPSAKSVHH